MPRVPVRVDTATGWGLRLIRGIINYSRDHDPLNLWSQSRRLLEWHFQQLLNRSPAQKIQGVHLERARQLLVETDLPIPKVAESSGFGSPEHFSRVFKSKIGHSPL